MANILLVEPSYRSKFPPLGLLRISRLHKDRGDYVTLVKGRNEEIRNVSWHRIYISSLYTWELPRTVKTIRYYLGAVSNPHDAFVGGIAATLFPNYIRERAPCTVVEGPIDRKGIIGKGIPRIDNLVPDYGLLDGVEYDYRPRDSYFCRVTLGCVRRCHFCSVPDLEPRYRYLRDWRKQISEARSQFGERGNLVLLDNNILAESRIFSILKSIEREGFVPGAKFNNRKRIVDFNQGIDARLVTRQMARALSRVQIDPVRLAFDYDAMEKHYLRAIYNLVDVGFTSFTNYLMFNYNDDPRSLYRRMKLNARLSKKLGILISGFPMKYIPVGAIDRHHISAGWKWRYLRGVQCVLQATHGVVSPNPIFFAAAFGNSYKEFLEIIAMPDRYIMHREKYKGNESEEWRKLYRKLTHRDKMEFLEVLEMLNTSRNKSEDIGRQPRKYRRLLEHHYPGGKVIRE